MQERELPTYRDEWAVYKADTCTQVTEAAERGELRFRALARGAYPGERLEKSELPGIRSVGYWDADRLQSWGLDWHRNEGVELTFLESGRLSYECSSGRHALQPNDLTISRPWQPHRLGDPNIGIGHLAWFIIDVGVRRPNQPWSWPEWIILAAADLEELTGMLRQNEHPVWHAPSDIRRCFQQLTRAVGDEGRKGDVSRLSVYINELLLLLLEMFKQQSISLDQSLSTTQRSVELFLNDLRYAPDEPWTLESMAEECDLGVTRFVHYCKQLTNLTPMQHLTRLRVERAAELLIEQPWTNVMEIAIKCGFSSSQYFATVFRRHTGVTPGAYRKDRLGQDTDDQQP